MKDTRKHSSEQQELSSGTSAGRSTPEIQEKLWAELFKTAVFALVPLCVVVLVSVAWFVSNSKVDSGGIMVSYQYDAVKLATKGDRQQAEIGFLNLLPGTAEVYNDETYYCTEQGEIALRLSDPSVEVSPGKSGEISFYIIPNRDGAQSATLHLGLAGYEKTKDENGNDTGSKINDLVLNSLLSGHILLFENCMNGQYSDWLPGSVSTGGLDYQITVSKSDAKKDEPWKVTIYWVWPLRYENLAKDFKVNDKNLFSSFIETQVKNLDPIGSTGYHYSQIFLTKDKNLASDDSRSDAYNQADEYIGTKADYLYVTVQTDLVN